MKVSFEQMKETIKQAYLKVGMKEEDANLCAQVQTETARDGVYSHGLNRVSTLIKQIQEGAINLDAEFELVNSFSVVEQYDGNFGIGIKNAKLSMQRAIEIAKDKGIGLVAIKNTSHWKRAATYTIDAAEAGYIGIAWSNTETNFPAWGSKDINMGNNPLTIAIPNEDKPIVLDIAMSQYSFGKLQVEASKGNELPFIGGYNNEGQLTKNPQELRESRRVFPAGYWKGSGLAIALELLGAILSNGNNSTDIDKTNKGSCVGCSQVFIAIDPKQFAPEDKINGIINSTVQRIKNSETIEGFSEVTFPGERMLRQRKDSMENGIEVDEEIWREIKNFKG